MVQVNAERIVAIRTLFQGNPQEWARSAPDLFLGKHIFFLTTPNSYRDATCLSQIFPEYAVITAQQVAEGVEKLSGLSKIILVFPEKELAPLAQGTLIQRLTELDGVEYILLVTTAPLLLADAPHIVVLKLDDEGQPVVTVTGQVFLGRPATDAFNFLLRECHNDLGYFVSGVRDELRGHYARYLTTGAAQDNPALSDAFFAPRPGGSIAERMALSSQDEQ